MLCFFHLNVSIRYQPWYRSSRSGSSFILSDKGCKALFFFVHQKECFSVRYFPPEKRRLRSDSVVPLPHTKASDSLISQMPDACEGLYFSVKISPPSSSFFMERPTMVLLPVFILKRGLHLSPSTHAPPRRPSALGPHRGLHLPPSTYAPPRNP